MLITVCMHVRVLACVRECMRMCVGVCYMCVRVRACLKPKILQICKLLYSFFTNLFYILL